jgi:tRNA pseudouridine38-40 synthase
MRWRIVLEYDGTGFVGWQWQPEGRTIQGVVEQALAKFLGHESRVTVSGRTDAGVHAEGQVASFDAVPDREPFEVRNALNALLPHDVACVRAERAPADFDPRGWSWGKVYRYRYLDRSARSALLRTRAWHVRSLDDRAMHAAAACLAGAHDFTSFRSAGCLANHPNRVMESFSVTRDGDVVTLEARGQGFLRHMVRIIAGTLAEVGHGKRPPEWVADVLAARDRTLAGQTAPPHGLTLVSVDIRDAPPPWSSREPMVDG